MTALHRPRDAGFAAASCAVLAAYNNVIGAQPGNGSFTLTLSKMVAGNLPVAWFVLD